MVDRPTGSSSPWDFLTPRVAAQHTPALIDQIGDRRSTWWVLAELGRRLGHELVDTSGEDATDDAMLAKITAGARCTIDELVAAGWWRRATSSRRHGWNNISTGSGAGASCRKLLVDQLAALRERSIR